MPTFIAKIPFWIWPLVGLILLALSIPGFLDLPEKKLRKMALSNPAPQLVDLQDFDPQQDVGIFGEVNVFAQTHPNRSYQTNSARIIPLFSALASPKEKRVQHVILFPKSTDPERWLQANEVGTARMGNLIEVSGQSVAEPTVAAAIAPALLEAGLDLVEPLVVIKPFENGRLVALSTPSRQTFGNPHVLAFCGIWLTWFGFVVWSQLKKLKISVKRRIGEIEERANGEDEVNRSQLRRKSRQLSNAEMSKNRALAEKQFGPKVSPAE